MTNLVQAFEHRVIEPAYYHRRFENDLLLTQPQAEQSWQDTAKRCALIVLPFLSLYKPFGTAISLSMGVVRSMTSLSSAWEAGNQGAVMQCGMAFFQTTIGVLSVAATIFSFTGGLAIITGIDTMTSAVAMAQHLATGGGEEAFEEFLQTAIGVLYCVSMFTGQLEIVLVISILHVLLSAYQSRREFIAGRHPEAIAKLIMGLVRVNQTRNVVEQIFRRNDLLSIEKYQRLNARALRGKENIEHLVNSPLQDLKVTVKNNEVVLTDAQGKVYPFGSHFHAYGKGLVKGANLAFRQVTVDGEDKIELDFKVNHAFRERIEQVINETKSLEARDLRDVLQLSHSHASDIHVQEGEFILSGKKLGSRTEILVDGLGKIMIGSSSDYPNLYDRVIVQLNEGKSLYAWHEALALLDLDIALHASTQEDIDRIKIGQLFRTIHPREALQLERSDQFFELPVEQLQAEVIERAHPDMKEAFATYLDKMEPREILPGRVRYAMPGIEEKSRELGARGLVAAVSSAYTDKALFDRVGSMLKMGMLSSETRFSNGMKIEGMSTGSDFYTGGADSVYTQMITSKDCADHVRQDYLYYSKVRLSISLKALETGSYQFYYDSFGSRTGRNYAKRPSLFEFIENHPRKATYGHEICFKERIPPDLIQGVIVDDIQTRDNFLEYLRKTDILQTNERGQEMVLNRPIDQFIRIGTHASEELFS